MDSLVIAIVVVAILPSWLWTNRSTYPYFYDATDKEWMCFQSGNDELRFTTMGRRIGLS